MATKQLLLFANLCLFCISECSLTAQSAPPYSSEVARHQSILICDFESARVASEATSSQPYETVEARVDVSRVLKDAGGSGLKPGFYDLTIRRSGSHERHPQYPAWADKDLTPQLSYVVYSDGTGDMRNVLAGTMAVDLVTEEEDLIGDLELIISSGSLSLLRQVEAAGAALRSFKVHSHRLAEYLAWLFFAGTDTETVSLLESLEGTGGISFSDHGKEAFLFHLHAKSGARGSGTRDNICRAFANLVVRYFIAEPQAPARRGRPERLATAILATYLPAIEASPDALTALKAVRLTPAEAVRLRAKALGFAADDRLTPEWRTQAQKLLALPMLSQ